MTSNILHIGQHANYRRKRFAISADPEPCNLRKFPRTQKEAGIDHREWEGRLTPPNSILTIVGRVLAGVMIGAGLLMVLV